MDSVLTRLASRQAVFFVRDGEILLMGEGACGRHVAGEVVIAPSGIYRASRPISLEDAIEDEVVRFVIGNLGEREPSMAELVLRAYGSSDPFEDLHKAFDRLAVVALDARTPLQYVCRGIVLLLWNEDPSSRFTCDIYKQVNGFLETSDYLLWAGALVCEGDRQVLDVGPVQGYNYEGSVRWVWPCGIWPFWRSEVLHAILRPEEWE